MSRKRTSLRVPARCISVRVGDSVKNFDGRLAWALGQLIAAGSEGCTSITHPGPRWSDYIFKLRRKGLNIETVTETHGGDYAGHHARYVLRTSVTVVETLEAGGDPKNVFAERRRTYRRGRKNSGATHKTAIERDRQPPVPPSLRPASKGSVPKSKGKDRQRKP